MKLSKPVRFINCTRSTQCKLMLGCLSQMKFIDSDTSTSGFNFGYRIIRLGTIFGALLGHVGCGLISRTSGWKWKLTERLMFHFWPCLLLTDIKFFSFYVTLSLFSDQKIPRLRLIRDLKSWFFWEWVNMPGNSHERYSLCFLSETWDTFRK